MEAAAVRVAALLRPACRPAAARRRYRGPNARLAAGKLIAAGQAGGAHVPNNSSVRGKKIPPPKLARPEVSPASRVRLAPNPGPLSDPLPRLPLPCPPPQPLIRDAPSTSLGPLHLPTLQFAHPLPPLLLSPARSLRQGCSTERQPRDSFIHRASPPRPLSPLPHLSGGNPSPRSSGA